jgi:hypothetical protein
MSLYTVEAINVSAVPLVAATITITKEKARIRPFMPLTSTSSLTTKCSQKSLNNIHTLLVLTNWYDLDS